MEVQGNVERYRIGDDGADEVSQDEACAWVTYDQSQGHDRQVDNGFGVDEEGKTDAKDGQ